MYIDCKTCGFESKDFGIFGTDYDKMLMYAVEANNCTATKRHGSYVIKCPNGHKADLFPITIKFMKRHPDFKIN